MANIKSQIKRNKQNDKRRLRNRVYRGQTRTAVKDARTAIEAGDAEVSKKSLLQAISSLDKAAEKGVLHKNNVARRKSRLMKLYNKMEPVEAAPAAQPAAIEEPAEAAPRKRAAKAEPKAEVKKAETKKPAEKKAETKKPAAKKTATKKPAEKKSTTPRKKTTAKK